MSSIGKYQRKLEKWLGKKLGGGGLADVRLGDIAEAAKDIVALIAGLEDSATFTTHQAIDALNEILETRLHIKINL